MLTELQGRVRRALRELVSEARGDLDRACSDSIYEDEVIDQAYVARRLIRTCLQVIAEVGTRAEVDEEFASIFFMVAGMGIGTDKFQERFGAWSEDYFAKRGAFKGYRVPRVEDRKKKERSE